MAQQSSFTAATDTQYGDDLPLRDGEIDAVQHLSLTIGEMQVADLY